MNISQEILGQGLTSDVKKVQINKKEYAIKLFKQTRYLSQIEKEINILSQIQHLNVVKFIEGNPEKKFMIIELLHQMDLFDILVKKKMPFQIVSIKYIIQQLAATIKYIHNLGFVHRDIKLENILFDKQLEIKICDFGFAEPLENQFVMRTSGTDGYLAPELQNEGVIHTKDLPITEVFSLGVCAFQLAFIHPPFRKSTKGCGFWRLISNNEWDKYWQKIDKQNQYNDEFRQLIQGMLESDPKKRMTIDQVLEHQFLLGGCKETFQQEVQERLKIE
ncbi:unnamed protein product [Paramecium pentaurelia]|uniref:Protein kinase domain-containing protein n=1 Tax=Paramecium pentaurelia TaxID=43138 RepID=A0A8S1XV26_9CILI|nr:unnamed protein product [Paramecium pentaurelia]